MRPAARHRGAHHRPAGRARVLELLPQRHARDRGRAAEGGDAAARLARDAGGRPPPGARPARASPSIAPASRPSSRALIEAEPLDPAGARGGDGHPGRRSPSSRRVRSRRPRCPTALGRRPRHEAPLLLRRDRAHRHRRVDRHARSRGRRRATTRAATTTSTARSAATSTTPSSTPSLAAEKVPTRDFERCIYFEGCMPIEEMARRGPDTLAFGPMRPVGLIDPRTGTRAFACVQLRQDDAEGRLYNMVGFQTKMTYPEQRRVFRMIPGLERGRVRPPRQPAPQHLRRRAVAAAAVAPGGAPQAPAAGRADRRRRGLRRVGGHGPARGAQRRAPACAASRRPCRRAAPRWARCSPTSRSAGARTSSP